MWHVLPYCHVFKFYSVYTHTYFAYIYTYVRKVIPQASFFSLKILLFAQFAWSQNRMISNFVTFEECSFGNVIEVSVRSKLNRSNMKSIVRQLKRRAIVASRIKLPKLDRKVSAGYCALFALTAAGRIHLNFKQFFRSFFKTMP